MKLFIVKWSRNEGEESTTAIVRAENSTQAHRLAVEQLEQEGMELNDYEDLDITDVTDKTGVIHTSFEFIS